MSKEIQTFNYFKTVSTGTQLVVLSLRQWNTSLRFPVNLRTVLEPFFNKLNAKPALEPLLDLFSQFDPDADDPFIANCLCSQHLSEPEIAFIRWLDQRDASPQVFPAFPRTTERRDRATATAKKVCAALKCAGLPLDNTMLSMRAQQKIRWPDTANRTTL